MFNLMVTYLILTILAQPALRGPLPHQSRGIGEVAEVFLLVILLNTGPHGSLGFESLASPAFDMRDDTARARETCSILYINECLGEGSELWLPLSENHPSTICEAEPVL